MISKFSHVVIPLVILLFCQRQASFTVAFAPKYPSTRYCPQECVHSLIAHCDLTQTRPKQRCHEHARLGNVSIQKTKKSRSSNINSNLFLSSSSTNSSDNEKKRRMFGVQLITGFSLTALRATLRGLTGVSVTSTMRRVTAIFPSWFRYFLQPLLVLYYTPLMIFRSWCDLPARKEGMAAHLTLIEGWKNAIQRAESLQKDQWPLHINANGDIEAIDDVVVTDAIVDSLDVAMNVKP